MGAFLERKKHLVDVEQPWVLNHSQNQGCKRNLLTHDVELMLLTSLQSKSRHELVLKRPPVLHNRCLRRVASKHRLEHKTISGTFTTLGDYTPLNSHRCPLFFCAQFCTSSKVFTRGPYSPLSLYTAEFAQVKSVQIQVHEGKQKLLLPPL